LKTRQAAFQLARGKLRGPEILTNFRAARWPKELFPAPVSALVLETRSRRAGRRERWSGKPAWLL